jgi:hypothetical protein
MRKTKATEEQSSLCNKGCAFLPMLSKILFGGLFIVTPVGTDGVVRSKFERTRVNALAEEEWGQ